MSTTEHTEKIDLDELDAILDEYRGKQWALIPLLQSVQDKWGYIPPETIEPVARAMGVFPSQVQGVVTFYSQFYTAPRGRNIIRICRGTACHVRGSGTILKIVKQQLGVEEGGTTPDYNFTLETVACLGACFLAPTMLVNHDYYGRLAPSRVMSIIKHYEPKKKDKTDGEV